LAAFENGSLHRVAIFKTVYLTRTERQTISSKQISKTKLANMKTTIIAGKLLKGLSFFEQQKQQKILSGIQKLIYIGWDS
jgi:hypothetical protein